MSDRTAAPIQGGAALSNLLLAALPGEGLCSLSPHLEPVALIRGQVLAEAGEELAHVYFVEAGTVALMAVFQNGATGVMATVGREGMVGVGALVGSEGGFGRHLVQVPGSAQAVEVSQFRRALRQNSMLRATCQAYARAFLGQVLQTIACSSIHGVEERCARWLLVSHDRSDSDTLLLTQDFLAQMVAVRRTTAAAAIRNLHRAGLIGYRQGMITILDRRRLEAAACECYARDRERYQQVLPGVLN